MDYRGNGSYLNYTSDIDLALLESDVFGYIEANIVSELCKDYLMVAVCATIYPMCTESDTIQQLCSEQCNDILNEDMCMQDAADVVEYINEQIGDPTINFTLDCSNSVNFAELYLESSVCYDDGCLSISIDGVSDNNIEITTSMPTDPTTIMPTTQLSIPEMYVS